ncbi:MAG: hypothetical protein ACOY3Y_07020 [Acidobacteriota bacterium]
MRALRRTLLAAVLVAYGVSCAETVGCLAGRTSLMREVESYRYSQTPGEVCAVAAELLRQQRYLVYETCGPDRFEVETAWCYDHSTSRHRNSFSITSEDGGTRVQGRKAYQIVQSMRWERVSSEHEPELERIIAEGLGDSLIAPVDAGPDAGAARAVIHLDDLTHIIGEAFRRRGEHFSYPSGQTAETKLFQSHGRSVGPHDRSYLLGSIAQSADGTLVVRVATVRERAVDVVTTLPDELGPDVHLELSLIRAMDPPGARAIREREVRDASRAFDCVTCGARRLLD